MPFFGRKKQIPEVYKEASIDLQDIIAPSLIEVRQNCIKIGERIAKTFFIFSYPRYLSTGWFSPVINLGIPMDVALFLHPVDVNLTLKQLRKRVTEAQAEMMEREEKGLIRDPALETAHRDLEQLRDKLITAQERMFEFGIYITVYAENEKEMGKIEMDLRSVLESRLVYIKPALYQQNMGFNSTAPYGRDLLLVHTPMNTAPLSSIFPFISFDLSSNQGILYGINQHNNSLILFDRFSLENANSTVFGVAGSGKTIHGNEPVLIKNKNRIQLIRIGPLIENLIKKHGTIPIDEEMEGVINPEIEVYSFDENLKGRWSKVTVAMRKKAPDIFYKFTTRSGREITTTGDHNMLILRNGKVMAAKSSEIKEGEFIPLPRNIPESQNPLKSFNLLKLLKNSKNIYVKGAEHLIQENYRVLKNANIDSQLDRYLYKYRDSRVIPIKYLWKILNFLSIKPNDEKLKELRIVSKNGKKKYSLSIKFPITAELLKIAGYICAEGMIGNEAIMVSNKDGEILQDIDFSLKKLGIPFYYGNRGVIIASRVFVEIIKALGGEGKSNQKKVLPFIFSSKREKIAQYLSAYFEGDGGVEKNIYISTTSKSPQLISELSYLLYCFGIIGRISKTRKRAANSDWKRKREYWKITISGQDNLRKFAKNINFISKRKKQQLSETIKKQGNTNVDLIPEIGTIFSEIQQIFPPILYGIHDIVDWKSGKRNPSPQHLQRVINKIEEKIQHFKNLSSTFKILTELPELAEIINLGENDKKLNRALWQTLNHSWQLIKNRKVKPRSINVFKAIKIINGNSYSLPEIKTAIHSGFREMDLTMKYFNPNLENALNQGFQSNTCYELIQRSAHYVQQNYQEVLINKISQIEEKLAQLKTLVNSDLFWDPIAKIKKIKRKKEKYVYDLTVDNEVFLAGRGGMFVHNSYAIKLEILRSLMIGVDCIVIDPENEYKFLSDAVGGSFFSISLSSKNHINPFDLPLPREDEEAADIIRTNVINLVGLLRIMLKGMTPEEDAIMDRALAETYASKDITPFSDPKTWENNTPLLEDLESVLETMEGTDSLLVRLRKFTKGTYANFFNQPSNIDMKNKMVVFGIRDMEDELRPIAIFTIIRYIWNTVKSELKKRILVIDEAWWMMKNEDGASFLFGIVKRARKYWLGVTTVTQDVIDFMKSDYGKPIITNSALHILMKQSPAMIEIVQKTFDLTDGEKNVLIETPVGDGLFFAGSKHVLMKVVASYGEDQFVTTSPEEVLKIRKAKQTLKGEIK